MYMSFMSMVSPKGGRPITDIMFRKMKPNLNITPEKRAQVVEDYYCWKIGYDSEGNHIFIKPSDALILYKFLKKELRGS